MNMQMRIRKIKLNVILFAVMLVSFVLAGTTSSKADIYKQAVDIYMDKAPTPRMKPSDINYTCSYEGMTVTALWKDMTSGGGYISNDSMFKENHSYMLNLTASFPNEGKNYLYAGGSPALYVGGELVYGSYEYVYPEQNIHNLSKSVCLYLVTPALHSRWVSGGFIHMRNPNIFSADSLYFEDGYGVEYEPLATTWYVDGEKQNATYTPDGKPHTIRGKIHFTTKPGFYVDQSSSYTIFSNGAPDQYGTNTFPVELVYVSQDGSEADFETVYEGDDLFTLECEHRNQVFKHNESTHWRVCHDCDPQEKVEREKGEHVWVLDHSTAIKDVYKCSVCEAEKEVPNGNQDVGAITINDVPPVAGGTLQEVTNDNIAYTGSERVSITGMKWYENSYFHESAGVPVGTNINGSNHYYLELTLDAKDGYAFDGAPVVYSGTGGAQNENNLASEYDPARTATHAVVYFDYVPCTKTALNVKLPELTYGKTTISNILNNTLIQTPNAGNTKSNVPFELQIYCGDVLQYRINYNSGTQQWSVADVALLQDYLEPSKDYTLVLTVKGYILVQNDAEHLSITGSNELSKECFCKGVNNGGVIATYHTDDGTAKDVRIKGLIPPTVGQAPCTSGALSIAGTDKATIQSLTWDPADPTFSCAKEYTATIVLDTTDHAHYTFPAAMSATVDGAVVSEIQAAGGTEATIICTYAPVEDDIDDSVPWTVTQKASFAADGSKYKQCPNNVNHKHVTTIPKLQSPDITPEVVYDGKVQTPTVRLYNAGGDSVAAGDFTVTYSNPSAVNVGSYGATVTIKDTASDYAGFAEAAYTIIPKELSKENLTLSYTSVSYTGKPQKPAVTVKVGDKVLTENTDFTIAYPSDITSVGSKNVTVTGKGNYNGSVSASYNITASGQSTTVNPPAASSTVTKVKQKPTITLKKKTVKAAKLQKKAVKVKNAIKVKDAFGKVTYKAVKKGSSKKLSIDKKTGVIKVKKKTKKGTYKLKVQVKAAGDATHEPYQKKVTVKVVVK